MKKLIGIVALLGSFHLNAQTIDSTHVRIVKPVKQLGVPVQKAEKVTVRTDVKLEIFGEYKIDSYAILSKKTPGVEELNALLGSLVKFSATTLTGTHIDPMTFTIYQVERLRRDDFIYRVFGREIKAPEPDLPESFNVHKTDNENCYGIVEISSTKIAIPYKGVLLFLTRS